MERIQGKITPFKQLYYRWRSLRNVPFRRRWFVGYDLEGNTFWEFQVDNGRMRRLVEYYEKKQSIAEYSQNKLHPRWSLWLTFTRPTPPTLQELVADEQRQQVMKVLAQRADDRWRHESVLTEDKKILREKVLSVRAAIGEEKQGTGRVETKDERHEPVLSPPRRSSSKQPEESPIGSAHIQPRR